MLKIILAVVVFLFLLLPLNINSAVKNLEENVDIEEVLKSIPTVVFVGLMNEENAGREGLLVYFEDKIIEKEGPEYYLRLTTDPSSGTIFSLITGSHLYKPNILYRVVFLDIYKLDMNSIGEGESNLKYKHYLEAYIVFYKELGSLEIREVSQDILPVEVFKDVLKEFEKKHQKPFL